MALGKKFANVELPIINESLSVIGNKETLDKKTIKLDLSRKLKGKGLEVTFAIIYKDEKLVGYPKSLLLMRSYIQRMMRKRINYVEDSITTSCKDVSVTIKPFLITRKKVSRAIRNNLRKTAREFIIEYVKDKTFLELAELIIHGGMQKEMHPRLKKVYPLSLCEIRIFETKELAKADLTIKEKVVEPAQEAQPEQILQEEVKEQKEEAEKEEKTEVAEDKKEKKPRKSKKEKIDEAKETSQEDKKE